MFSRVLAKDAILRNYMCWKCCSHPRPVQKTHDQMRRESTNATNFRPEYIAELSILAETIDQNHNYNKGKHM